MHFGTTGCLSGMTDGKTMQILLIMLFLHKLFSSVLNVACLLCTLVLPHQHDAFCESSDFT